jgi:catalase
LQHNKQQATTLLAQKVLYMQAINMHQAQLGILRNVVPRACRGVRSFRVYAAAQQNGNGNGAHVQGDGNPQLRPSVHRNTPYLTTNDGKRVDDNEHTMTAGARGPALHEDTWFQEKMAQFDREKTPERVVHARGMTAKGFFEVTHDVSDLTCAHFLNEVGRKTDLAVRYSMVTHEKGSPESLRDVRGLSIKFYTGEGNYDFVGNHIPVFFVRDGMKFPDLVHAMRPNPKTHVQEAWRILDFLGSYPESTHILTWLLDYVGIVQDWRHMSGYGVNTFIMVNKEGKETLVKLHFLPQQGEKYMTNTQSQLAGQLNMRHSHATYDLVNAITEGDYPKWDMYVQEMDPAKQNDYWFDPLDCTKVWPEDEFPLRPVGTMTVNKNISNFHNENEQIAFNPANIVPGITFSNDKVLQTRVFSYGDTQRYRLGVNYQTLPINQPRCPFHINNHDGAMNFVDRDEEINYQPSLMSAKEDKNTPANPGTTERFSKEPFEGVRVRSDYPNPGDDYRQAGERYRSFDLPRKAYFEQNMVEWLGDPKAPQELRDIWLKHWEHVDSGLATRLRAELKGKQVGTKIIDKVGDVLKGQANKEHKVGTTKA